MIDQVPLASTGLTKPFPADEPPRRLHPPIPETRAAETEVVQRIAAYGDSKRSPINRADAVDRRRVLRDLPRRSSDRPRLRQARAGQAQGRRRLARAGRAQPLGGRVDARRRRHRARRRFPRSWARIARPDASRWRISPPDTHPVWKDLLRAGTVDAGDGGGRRRRARPDSRGDGGPARHRRAVSDRRHLPRDPPRALSRRHGARASRSRAALRRAGRRRRAPRSACWSTAISARRTC